ncbi:MAG: MATE family efflux transporter, partial [Terrisporobacter sp.]
HKVLKAKFRGLKFDKDILKGGMKLGVPSGLQQMLFSFENIALQSLVNGYGTSAMGANKMDIVKNGLKASLKISTVISILVTVLFLLFSKDLISSFILTSAIKGAGDSMFALISSMISLWLVRIPCAYLFAELFGVNGIWMGIPSGWLIGGIITSIYYKKGSWKSKCVVSFDHVSLDAN